MHKASQQELQVNTEQSVDRLLHMYRQMVRIRFFEEKVNELYLNAIMPGLSHLSIGQEAVAAGACEALRREDYITSNHRGHGHCLAKGATAEGMFAELLGKEAGVCRGKGGSMHIADSESGNLGANAIVAGSAGIATGAAFTARYLNTGQVAVCFFGDGSLGQGVIYEVMNMAQLWKLPVLYFCENNLYSEYTYYKETTAGELTDRARAFGMYNEAVDGQDAEAVYQVTRRAVERARGGEGPAFIVANTYRYFGHHVGDIDRAYYRSKEEEQDWKTNRDPLHLLSQKLVDQGMADQEQLDQIARQCKDEIEAAAKFAMDAPFPDLREVDQHVYVENR